MARSADAVVVVVSRFTLAYLSYTIQKVKGLFGRALALLKIAPALASLKSSSFRGAEAVLKNVWQNGSFALDNVNPQQGATRSSFFRHLLRRQKMAPALDRLPMRSPFQNRRLAQLLQEPELKPLQEPCQRGS